MMAPLQVLMTKMEGAVTTLVGGSDMVGVSYKLVYGVGQMSQIEQLIK